MLASTWLTQFRSAAVTSGRAKRAVMPLPIRAGVLGMARITRPVPSHCAMLSLRMPAATLRCRAPRVCASICPAASLKICGLTAQTTRSTRFKKAPAVASAVMPKLVCSLSRAGAKGSTTSMCAGAMPWLMRPPMMALAILPPPINAMRLSMKLSAGWPHRVAKADESNLSAGVSHPPTGSAGSTVWRTACSQRAISACA